jgi:hypothetical protein
MQYLVTGETINTGQRISPEQFFRFLDKGIILTAEAYNKLGYKNKILGNGKSTGARTGVAIVEGESHEEVNRILEKFSTWHPINWTVTPLENGKNRDA